MITFGGHLLAALLAGFIAWCVGWICGRLGAPGWVTSTLTGATLVYLFWLLLTVPIVIGQ
jgi:hypothetical protein